jgi:hypothetical protein
MDKKLETIAINWLNKNYNHMEPFIMEEYTDYIFHMKDGKCILQYNKKNGYVYVSYREIWSFFESYFSMSNQQIKDITKIWVEEHYKKNITTERDEVWQSPIVEENYKKSEITTDKYIIMDELVEEHYKEIQTTDNQNEFYFNRDVEELYNQYTDG